MGQVDGCVIRLDGILSVAIAISTVLKEALRPGRGRAHGAAHGCPAGRGCQLTTTAAFDGGSRYVQALYSGF